MLGLADVAVTTGVTVEELEAYEAASVVPDTRTLERIAFALGIGDEGESSAELRLLRNGRG
jgi:transcriptional regulator with XRE-family HTH domain